MRKVKKGGKPKMNGLLRDSKSMKGTKEEGRENGVYEEWRGQKRRVCEESARV